ncbi:hypothetical protein [Streptomyces sp. NPDC005408]|uniref:hypothetical protein n=1 Tax=Streptomyces sp. NPDC005408 TaxID=3155341 RepID=UPI0033A973E1
MFTPIICGACTCGRYRPTGADLYECSECGHELTATDFVLDPEELLVCHEGSMHTRLAEAVSGLYEVRPTHGVQGPFVRATLLRALRRQEVFTGTDQVNAANRLKFDEHLPDRGPWYLTKDELRALAAALRWRLASSDTVDPRHQTIAQAIYDAADQARQPQ